MTPARPDRNAADRGGSRRAGWPCAKGPVMSAVKLLILSTLILMLPVVAMAQPDCSAPAMTDDQVKAIIAKERKARKDLPEPFAESQIVIRRQGCHYHYIEYAVPRTPDKQNIITLNQEGVIVDTQPATLECPDKTFTESELAEIVKQERATRKNLPAPYPQTRIRVDRDRCLYMYFEYAVPESPGRFQVFTVDPLGAVLDFYRNKP
jgi:hypothetical protein